MPEMNADETQTNSTDVKVNGTADSDSQAPVTSQKYSQILADHHTNSSSQQYSKNSSSHHIYKPRGYNNKENNFFNQRPGGRAGAPRSWQRGGNYRTSILNGKDRKPEEHEKAGANDAKVDSTAEPIKFNEGKRKVLFLLQLAPTCENVMQPSRHRKIVCTTTCCNCFSFSFSPSQTSTRA